AGEDGHLRRSRRPDARPQEGAGRRVLVAAEQLGIPPQPLTSRGKGAPPMPIPNASRRQWLKLAASGVSVTSTSGWIEALAADTAAHPGRRRSCILLWMNGGPS